jgi:SAM-dependent methyltransferase
MPIDLGTGDALQQPDGRLNFPAFHRNRAAIWSVLAPLLAGRRGDVLELGSGSGQHVVAFAEQSPDLVWWPSDIDPDHLASIEAWRRHAKLPNVRAPRRIDLADPDWNPGADAPARFAMILCINVLHISPWIVSRNLFARAARLLVPEGRLCVYGPFRRGGQHTAPSNAAFDASLRRQNAEWGVRDLDDLAILGRDGGLALADVVAMPANNLTLVFVTSQVD